MSTLTRLRELHFSTTEKRIADFILKNADELPGLTISEVAQACDTSKSMVVQLCKTAGFKGYKDLCSQLLVRKALNEQRGEDPEVYEDVLPGATSGQIAQAIIRQEVISLQATLDLVDPAALDKAVEIIRHADRILLLGVGGSAMAAMDMHNKLSRIGLNSRFNQDVHCQLLETSGLTDQSVALVISFSGKTKDLIEACELSREMGAKVISITRPGRNPIADISDVNLPAASDEGLRRVTTMSSRISTMSMVDVLFACLASTMSEQIKRQVQRNTEIANRRRK